METIKLIGKTFNSGENFNKADSTKILASEVPIIFLLQMSVFAHKGPSSIALQPRYIKQ